MPLEFQATAEVQWSPAERETDELVLDIGSREIWRAIDSPYRLRLFEMIRRSNGLTINEMAKECRTNPVNLYYHIRTLEAHKLIFGAGHREGVARRAPVVYMASNQTIRIEYDPNSKVDQKRISQLQKAWQKEAELSLEHSNENLQERDENIIRWEFLSESQHQEIKRYLDRVSLILEQARETVPGEESDRSLHYVGFQVTNVPEEILPAPKIRLQSRPTMEERTKRSKRELVETKMQA